MKFSRLCAALMIAAVGLTACGDDSQTPSPPGAPSGITMTPNGTTITVTWTAGSGATSHRVTLSTPGETDRTETTADAATTTVEFTGLTQGSTYAALVVAINGDGETAGAIKTAMIDPAAPTYVDVTEDILSDKTWTSDKVWRITKPIFVGVDCGTDGADPDCVSATLTIEPGTTVVGQTNLSQGVRGAYLVISRGSKIIADATGADRPPTAAEVIVFTSDKPKGQRARGDWGGLVINGRATTNAGVEAEGEGDSGFYGGDDDEDDSGIIRGVRIEFAGDRVTPTDELNGLAPQGVGSGTTVSYVQVHYNVDDGTEPFGGTVSMDHVVLTGIGDDTLDGTDGWRGWMQFVVGQQRGDEADNGMEISNDGQDSDASPKSTGVIANATMIGAGNQAGEIGLAANGDRGVQFREASHHRVYNSIFRDFGDAGFCVENAGTVANADNRLAPSTDPQTTISFESNVLWNNAAADDDDLNFEGCDGYTTAENKTFFETAGFNNILADPLLAATYNTFGTQSAPPEIIASAAPTGYTAFDLTSLTVDDVNLFDPTDGRTLVDTDYPGAVEPGTALGDAWYNGWTVWTVDGSDSRANHLGN
ncbi:MAG: fibronectin type III domain-containing protein [Gemmatimonadota bacterium]